MHSSASVVTASHSGASAARAICAIAPPTTKLANSTTRRIRPPPMPELPDVEIYCESLARFYQNRRVEQLLGEDGLEF